MLSPGNVVKDNQRHLSPLTGCSVSYGFVSAHDFFFGNQILSVPNSRENKVLKKHSKKKSIAGGDGRMLET